MPDESNFVAAIIDRPDDDGPRLIFADWLEERGDCERAEFIRIQCELASLDPDAARSLELQQRERELLKQEDEWLRPLYQRLAEHRETSPPSPLQAHAFRVFREFLSTGSIQRFEAIGSAGELLSTQREMFDSLYRAMFESTRGIATGRFNSHFEFRRGFVERVQMPAGELADHAEVIFTMHPIRQASVHDGPFGTGFRKLFACTYLERLAELELRGLLASDVLMALANSPHLSRLRKLDIQGMTISADGASTLGNLPNMPELRELALRGLLIGDELVAALARNRAWNNLEHLNLSATGLSDEGLESLANSPHLGSLQSLNVSSNRVSGAGVGLLARSNRLNGLVDLDLSHNRLGDSMAQGPNRWVTRLIGNRTPSPWVQALLDSPLGCRLRQLQISGAQMNPVDRYALEERFQSKSKPAI